MNEGFAVIEERRSRAGVLTPDELAELRTKIVAIVGLGTLGGPLAALLSLVGVATILVDFDVVEPANLAHQHFTEADLGQAKAAVRARQVRALSREAAVEAVVARVEDLGLARFAGVALLVSCVDSFTSRVRLGEIATRLGVPLLDCALDGSGELELGLVTAYDAAAGGPCFLCAVSARELGERLAHEKPSHCPSFRDPTRPVTRPTLAGAAQASIVAGFAAQRALALLLGRGGSPVGTRLVVAGGASPRIATVKLARNHACLHDHRYYAPRAVLAEATVEATLAAAAQRLGGDAAGGGVTSVRFPARTFVVGLACACGAESAVTDVIGVLGSAPLASARCDRCGSSDLEPRAVTDTLTGAALAAARALTWAELGVPRLDFAEISNGTQNAIFVLAAGKEA